MKARLRRFALLLGIACLAGLGLAGCASRQFEQHIFAATELEGQNPVVKFYRISIKAKARNMKTSYQAGFYDADAVRSLFGEVRKQEDESGTLQQAGTLTLELEGNRWSVVNQDTLFTIVYGADATAIATQIQAFANSDANAAAFSRLLGAVIAGDAFLEIDEVKAESLDLATKKKIAAERLNTLAATLDGGETPAEELEQELRTTAVLLANIVGPTAGIPRIPDAADAAALRAFIERITDALLQQSA